MRVSEWISVGFFGGFMVAGLLASLAPALRWRVVGLGVAGIVAAVALPVLEGPAGGRPGWGLLRDLAPGAFLLMVYWQSGAFFRRGETRVQETLHAIDRWLFPGITRPRSELEPRPILATYLEGAYFLCYPVVPLAVCVLYLADQRAMVDPLWTVVLPPTFACYVLTALFPSLPPRVLEGRSEAARDVGVLGAFNRRILRSWSIPGNTFPSGHVTCSLAIALVLWSVLPLAGAAFLWISASITVAAVALRYHFAADAIFGIALATLSFGVLR